MRAPKPDPDKAQTGPAPDTALRGFVGYHVKRAGFAVQSEMARVLKPFQLRMVTYSALAVIVDNPGLRQSQLADALVIERPNLVVIIDELENRALILRDRVPTDRRAYALRATPAGQKLAARASQAVTQSEQAMLAGIDADARETVIRAMGAIEHNLKTDRS